jgi:phosphatidylserine/phosphatidylglycerophosphate/cardiolipin synthase-like enzyme
MHQMSSANSATGNMKLLVQPGDSVTPLIKGINGAQKSIEIVIFRFDRPELERALKNAIKRGVFVHALIAYTNRGGEKNLRKLEMRLLAAGASVARTDDDLIRYHDKFLIVDRHTLFLLAFNFTYLDINHSRSFGIVTRDSKVVQEAVRLFEADTKRQPYTAEFHRFVVSPVNARKELARFVGSAKKSLLIYDLKVSDSAMIRLLRERAKAGVQIRVIGWVTRNADQFESRRLGALRLHARAIVRDGAAAFIGSQSLRALELDARREAGVIFRDTKAVKSLEDTFEQDWKSAVPEIQESHKPTERVDADEDGRKLSVGKAAKQVAKAIAQDLPPVSPLLRETVKRAAGEQLSIDGFSPAEVEETVKDAVKSAVKQIARDVIERAVNDKPIENL